MHWAVRVVHLLLGISAMGLIEPMVKAIRRNRDHESRQI
jgi:hypothetical protein